MVSAKTHANVRVGRSCHLLQIPVSLADLQAETLQGQWPLRAVVRVHPCRHRLGDSCPLCPSFPPSPCLSSPCSPRLPEMLVGSITPALLPLARPLCAACASPTRQFAVNELIVGVIIYRGGVGMAAAGVPWSQSAAVFVISQRVC